MMMLIMVMTLMRLTVISMNDQFYHHRDDHIPARYDLTENDDFDREEIATYEEVARLFPRTGRYRPIILIGELSS